MTDRRIKIIGFTGSLQSDSFNRSALRAAGDLFPSNVDFEIVEPFDLPFFNEEVESRALPEAVTAFKYKLSEADAFLISTPEYNYSMSGVLKNALDWFSRGETAAFINKKTAITSASISRFGGLRAQAHLREVLLALDADVISSPELFVANANEIFEGDKLINERVLKQITKFTNSILE